MTQIQLKVSGMTCGHCVGRVTNAISAVAGVQNVQVNLESGTATIDAENELNIQAVKDAVVAVGFTA